MNWEHSFISCCCLETIKRIQKICFQQKSIEKKVLFFVSSWKERRKTEPVLIFQLFFSFSIFVVPSNASSLLSASDETLTRPNRPNQPFCRNWRLVSRFFERKTFSLKIPFFSSADAPIQTHPFAAPSTMPRFLGRPPRHSDFLDNDSNANKSRNLLIIVLNLLITLILLKG